MNVYRFLSFLPHHHYHYYQEDYFILIAIIVFNISLIVQPIILQIRLNNVVEEPIVN